MPQLTLAEEGLEVLFGTRDQNLKRIERAFDVEVMARGNRLQIDGEPEKAALVERLLAQLSALLENGYRLQPSDVETAIRAERGLSFATSPRGAEGVVLFCQFLRSRRGDSWAIRLLFFYVCFWCQVSVFRCTVAFFSLLRPET